MDEFDLKFIHKIETHILDKVLEKKDKISIQIHNRLSTATPVDYGQARAGWNFTLNFEDLSSPKKPQRAKKGESKNIIEPKQSAPNDRARKIGESYFITNTVDHLVYLNEGHSPQANPNFIEREIAQAVNDIEVSE